MTLIASISGIRGTIGGPHGQGLTPIDLVQFCTAYAEYIKAQNHGRLLVVGRDARVSGEMVSRLVTGTLMACGLDVLDLGLTTTPTLETKVPRIHAAGGIVLTASHNPGEWNALKLLDHEGCFLGPEDGAALLERVRSSVPVDYAAVDHIGSYSTDQKALDEHLDEILALPEVRRDAIARMDWKIIVDGINSSGAFAVPALLRRLGIQKIEVLNAEPNGRFAHNPEPLREHLDEICSEVVRQSADLGIVVDPDVDRLAFVCEDGSLFGEEYTLVAVADYILGIKKGPAVSNLSSSRALRDLCLHHGQDYHASAVGEVNVVRTMRKVEAVIGGEGNGGVIFPDLHYGRDALVGIALFLSHLALKATSVKTLRDSYPRYEMAKEKVSFDPSQDPEALLQKLAESFPNAQHNREDGLKIDLDKSWLHVRKSNTEPILRIYTEAPTAQEAKDLALVARQILGSF
ncbi:MAG: phosphoglucosamine mutase [Bacteroidia bacterium]|jgi:phosphomannomutase